MTREPGWLSGSWLVRQLGRSWLLGRVGSLYFDDPDLVGGDDTATPSVDTGLGEPTAAELDGHSTGRYSVAWENGDTEVLTENQLALPMQSLRLSSRRSRASRSQKLA